MPSTHFQQLEYAWSLVEHSPMLTVGNKNQLLQLLTPLASDEFLSTVIQSLEQEQVDFDALITQLTPKEKGSLLSEVIGKEKMDAKESVYQDTSFTLHQLQKECHG